MRTALCLAIPAALIATIASPARANSAGDFPTRAAAIVKEYLDWRPGSGVALGLHEYDGKFTDLSAASIDAQLKWLKRTRAEVDVFEVSLAELNPGSQELYDARILRAALAKEIFGIEEMASFTQNPMAYAGGPDVSIYVTRNFAPLPARAKSIIALLESFPQNFAWARANLAEVLPKPYVETAIQVAQGSADFLAKDLVEALKPLADETLQAAFQKANARAVTELKGFADWLRKEKLPKADASFALGPKKYRRMLAATELVDLDPAEILKLGLAELKAEQARFATAARVIDPNRTPLEVYKAIQHEHPTVEGLIPDTRKSLESIRSFVINNHLVRVPSEVRAKVEETLPFNRATSFASMDTPGPFEKVATEAYYYVTPAEKFWPKEQQEEWLTSFNFFTGDIVTVHEAYPGHYVQFLHLNASAATPIEKIFGSYAFIEGWAHYCEQMMVEEGFGAKGEDRVHAAKIRMAQSDEALLRVCRLCASVMLHTQGATVEQVAKFFEENCYYEPKPAMQEAIRGTFDPGYLNYTLGKLQILKLRADWKKQEGAKFTLLRFHDEMLKRGMPPIRLLRGEMLRDKKLSEKVL